MVAKALDGGINLRLVDGDTVGISTDETTVRADIVAVDLSTPFVDLVERS